MTGKWICLVALVFVVTACGRSKTSQNTPKDNDPIVLSNLPEDERYIYEPNSKLVNDEAFPLGPDDSRPGSSPAPKKPADKKPTPTRPPVRVPKTRPIGGMKAIEAAQAAKGTKKKGKDASTTKPSAESPISLTCSDGSGLQLRVLESRTVVDGPLAFTELRLRFHNPESRTREGRFAITLPPRAAISRFAMRIRGKWMEGEVVEKQRARRVYEDFLHRRQDPAILEQDAGNTFRARVFPINGNADKELIVSFSQELADPHAPIRVPLRGLGKLVDLKLRAFVRTGKTGQDYPVVQYAHIERKNHTPAVDLLIRPDRAGPRAQGLRHAQIAVARVQLKGKKTEQRFDRVVVLADTSASQAPNFERRLRRLQQLVQFLGDRGASHVTVLAFDQSVVPVYAGKPTGFGATQLTTLRRRGALGGSNLSAALSAAGKQLKGGGRVVLFGNGVATLGTRDADGLRKEAALLGQRGATRLDTVTMTTARDMETLRALATADLAFDGVHIQLNAEAGASAFMPLSRGTLKPVQVAIEGAGWVWPTTLRGLQDGDHALVYAELPQAAPLKLILSGGMTATVSPQTEVTAEPLIRRAWVRARIELLLAGGATGGAEQTPDEAAKVRIKLRAEALRLSIKHRVLCTLTALLVLETERDYARYKIDRKALANILTVTPQGAAVTRSRAQLRKLLESGRGATVEPTTTGTQGATAQKARDRSDGVKREGRGGTEAAKRDDGAKLEARARPKPTAEGANKDAPSDQADDGGAPDTEADEEEPAPGAAAPEREEMKARRAPAPSPKKSKRARKPELFGGAGGGGGPAATGGVANFAKGLEPRGKRRRRQPKAYVAIRWQSRQNSADATRSLRSLRRHVGAIRYCYESLRRSSTKLLKSTTTNVELRFTLRPNGRVKQASVLAPDPKLRRCILLRIRRLSGFPASLAGPPNYVTLRLATRYVKAPKLLNAGGLARLVKRWKTWDDGEAERIAAEAARQANIAAERAAREKARLAKIAAEKLHIVAARSGPTKPFDIWLQTQVLGGPRGWRRSTFGCAATHVPAGHPKAVRVEVQLLLDASGHIAAWTVSSPLEGLNTCLSAALRRRLQGRGVAAIQAFDANTSEAVVRVFALKRGGAPDAPKVAGAADVKRLGDVRLDLVEKVRRALAKVERKNAIRRRKQERWRLRGKWNTRSAERRAEVRDEKQRKLKDKPAVLGHLRKVHEAIASGDTTKALVIAWKKRHESATDVVALVALGDAFMALGRREEAARAYGSLIDLFPSRADLRRYAGNLIERAAGTGDATAVDIYRVAVEQRPDHPAGHHMLAMALAERGAYLEALDAALVGLRHRRRRGNFSMSLRILEDDMAIIASAAHAANPSLDKKVDEKLFTRGLTRDTTPSLRFILTWETDSNDVDFHIFDCDSAHAYYSDKHLPNGMLFADITTGYGPECFRIDKPAAYPYTLMAHYYRMGPMGYGMGRMQILRHDGNGGLGSESRPYAIMRDGAWFDMGEVTAETAAVSGGRSAPKIGK